ncbi:PQQ-dependent sugar dehydrogenase [Luteolibacter ambystomatis]|uniref:PQQ-dependent sugar dehydrogenase n=1 Tax=Luteolibacter ambystomatis TaxID=2824561 RepID=A0A975G8N3_9BACT|nr:LamG-like jellyroll fold domain-containing protein [Luteolibacter ambystomatis]QUE51003.1 PQQ-dependent sugar dehydrogenase [Luteolibacter ambystomatis]
MYPRFPTSSIRGICLLAVGLGILPLRGEMVNRWSFNNAAGNATSGTTVTDSVSGTLATVRGNGSTFTGTALKLTGTTTGNRSAGFISGYIDLPNGIISSKTNLSVEIWATPISAKNYSRLFDFGRVQTAGSGGGAAGEIIDITGTTPGATTSSDSLMLSFTIGTNLSQQRMEARLNGGTAIAADTAIATTANTGYHYVFTFADGVGTYGSTGGRITWYRNATQIATKDVPFRLSQLEDVNNWLGRSLYTTDDNANASYDEVRLYNHVLTQAEISTNYAAGPDQLATPTTPPTPDHLWTFTTLAASEVASGQTFTDTIGGMPVVLKGNGATLSGSAVTLPGNTTGNQPASTISAYLDLPNGIVSAHNSITFEAWATPLSSKNYQRLFDFGRGNLTTGTDAVTGEINDSGAAPGASAGYDNLVLSLNVAGNLGTHRLEGQINNGAAIFTDSAAATTAGTEYHYVLVVEDGGGTYGASGSQARWYRNGILQNSLSLPYHLSQMQDVNNWIGRSQYTGDSNSNLSLNELRIYNRALGASEILASYNAGADPSSGPPEPPAPAPIPVNRWSFDAAAGNAPSGTPFTASGKGTIATVRGNGATLTGTQIVLPGTTTGNQTAANISAYIDLPNGLISSNPSQSWEAWVTPVSSKTWQRIFDFGKASITKGAGAVAGEIIDDTTAPGTSQSVDDLLLSLEKDAVLGSHRLESLLAGANKVTIDTDLSTSTTAGTEYHIVMTVEDGAGAYGAPGCRVKWYRNAVLQGSADLAYRITELSDVNNWIGRSIWTADNNANISINDLRMYDRAITAREVTTSYNAGAATVFPAPVATADSATISVGQKVLVDVLANDTGGPLGNTLQIAQAPTTGTAMVKDGKILYTHAGTSATPVTFTYRVTGVGGISDPGTVTVNVSTDGRFANPNLGMPQDPPVNAIAVVNAFPGLGFTKALCFTTPPGDTKRLFVCEIGGLLKVIPDVTAASPTAATVLNLNTAIATPSRTPAETITGGANGECGLLGLAFHPNYSSNGYFYLAYSATKAGSSGFYERVSRFTVPQNQLTAAAPVADPSSELILIEQYDEGPNHNGGDLHFGPDGYLYWSVGDEENPNDFRLNSQRINKDFFSGLFRIDVDKKPGNPEPNMHAAVPRDNGVARYSVPADNPWVGATSFNGLTVDPATVRTEFFAVGLRSPWRFSFDTNGEIWLGDVGQDRYEELDIITKGGNYGWVYREGLHDINVTNAGWPAKPANYTSIDPIWEYNHAALAGDSNFKGNSIIGGVVYHGDRLPSLKGSYIFGDQVSGNIWSLTRAGNVPGGEVTVVRIGGQAFLSNFGTDPSNGDVLVSDYFGGRIMRIAPATPTNSFPTTLSATGLFADLTDLSPAPSLIPYTPNVTFWSDNAVKQRWFSIPDGTSKMTFSKDGAWTYPAGQIWVKHFDMEMDRGNPATKKRIETRVLVKNSGGAYGVSYRWNDAQTEANLVEDGGVDFPLTVSVNGTPTTQQWRIPGRSQCMSCHTPINGNALSFNTRQLNRLNTINGTTGNQMDLLQLWGYLSNEPGPSAALPKHPALTDTSVPVEARVRSYLDVNCSYCHQQGGAGPSWDGRAKLTLEETGLIHGIVSVPQNPGDELIAPADSTHSAVLSRMSVTNGYSRMPPLASNVIDQDAINLVTEWIQSELPSRPLYDTWRGQFFASGNPLGAKDQDPDGDGLTNYQEYLLGSSPLAPNGGWQATVDTQAGKLKFIRKAYRNYKIESSDDLLNWNTWDVPQTSGLYKTSDTMTEVPLNPADTRKFFRFKVSEP